MKNDLYIHGEPAPRRRYFIVDERTDGTGDSFGESFFTADEAIAAASAEWRYLTDREKSMRHIIVGYIDANRIPDDVIGERSIIGDVDQKDYAAGNGENWYSNFSEYDVIFECK